MELSLEFSFEHFLHEGFLKAKGYAIAHCNDHIK
jgi:hypothetical protein